MTQAVALRADRLLDRRLMQARTPEPPSGLAARIVSQATRLPQQRQPVSMSVPVAVPARVSSRGFGNWLQAASVAALLLVSAGTATIFQNGGSSVPPATERLAQAAPVAAAPQLAGNDDRIILPNIAVPGNGPIRSIASAREDAELSAPPVIELAREEPVPDVSAADPQPVLAKADATRIGPQIGPQDWSLPSAPTQIYGPVASPSGLGIAGGIYGSGTARSGMAISGGVGLGGAQHR